MVLFLYSELASYTLSCLRELKDQGEEVHLVRWPVNKEAPFQFDFEGITLLERSDYSDDQLVEYAEKIQPDVIISSGWMDKGYLKVCKQFKGKIPTVLTLDNHWRGDVKQKIASTLSPFFIKSKFSHAWVPGAPQVEFAEKLRFKKENIYTRFYSADTSLFNSFYEEFKTKKNENPPKVFIYLGRYIQHKGIFDMWNAFIEIQNESPNEWEFWCFGTGDQFENKTEHPKIKHFGFIQPSDLGEKIESSGVYILPSHFEPWGVSLHEFASAGFPLLCSEQVGASEAFLKDGVNGFSFAGGDVQAIKLAMKKMINLTVSERSKMHEISHELGKKVNPSSWVKTYFQIKNSMS